MEEFKFFLEVLVAGLLSGIMYSLVALGFVLIYKTSGVFNFAQGAQLLFAALTFVSLNERGLPMWAAFAVSLVIMVLLGILIERVVLRPLVAQTQITLFMATIGLSFIIEGAAQLVWGTEVHSLDLGIDDIPMDIAGVFISRFRSRRGDRRRRHGRSPHGFLSLHPNGTGVPGRGAGSARVIVCGAALGSYQGRGLGRVRANRSCRRTLWGARLGVQFSLSLVVLKALPVLVLGGFDSIAGAIVGGLIIGAAEKLAEIYIGPYLGGGIEGWFAYVAALIFLMIRPTGLFGQRFVERV